MGNANGHAATLTPWKPGESGNRAGTPPGKKVTLRFCRIKSLAMAKVLVSIAEDDNAPPAARTAAASAVLDRAWGKPATQDQHELGSEQRSPALLKIVVVDPQNPQSETVTITGPFDPSRQD